MTELPVRGSDEYEALAQLLPDDLSDPGDDLEAVRAKFDEVHGHDPGPGVVVEAAPSGLGLWVHPEGGGSAGTVFFVHGGGFVTSDAASYAFYGALLARATGWSVFVADYPLAPESVFPAQLDALSQAFATDVAAPRGAGVDGPVVLMGDSCGATGSLPTGRSASCRCAVGSICWPMVTQPRTRSGATRSWIRRGSGCADSTTSDPRVTPRTPGYRCCTPRRRTWPGCHRCCSTRGRWIAAAATRSGSLPGHARPE